MRTLVPAVPLSLRQLREIMAERSLGVDHVTIWRWVQRYAPELNRRCRPEVRRTNVSWRCDETYVRVAGKWTYLYHGCRTTLPGRPQSSAASSASQSRDRPGPPTSPSTASLSQMQHYPQSSSTCRSACDRRSTAAGCSRRAQLAGTCQNF